MAGIQDENVWKMCFIKLIITDAQQTAQDEKLHFSPSAYFLV